MRPARASGRPRQPPFPRGAPGTAAPVGSPAEPEPPGGARRGAASRTPSGRQRRAAASGPPL
eukprot:3152343-Lingulodinium_polyedra.AAC.1